LVAGGSTSIAAGSVGAVGGQLTVSGSEVGGGSLGGTGPGALVGSVVAQCVGGLAGC